MLQGKYIVLLLLLLTQLNPVQPLVISCVACVSTCAAIATGTIPAAAIALLFGPLATLIVTGTTYLGATGCLAIVCPLVCVAPIP